MADPRLIAEKAMIGACDLISRTTCAVLSALFERSEWENQDDDD